MSDTLLIALIVGVVGPSIMALLTGRLARANKREDWARADTLASVAAQAATRAESAASKLLASQDETVAAIVETNAKLVEVAEVGRVVHSLVNSDMTAARKSELEQARATLVVLRKVVALDSFAGRQSDPEDVEAIHTTLARIAELTEIVAERVAAQKALDDKAAADLTAVEMANGDLREA